MAKKPKFADDPIKALFKAIKSLLDPAPHSGDDDAAQAETAAASAGSVQVTPVRFSDDARAALSILALRSQVNAIAPHRSKASDGILGDAKHAKTKSDHNPWVKDGSIGVVTAIDITHDPADGCDAGLLAESIVRARDPRIKYVIFNGRIASSQVQPWVWRPYGGSNPHAHHVHLSVRELKSLYDDTSPWDLTGMPGGSKSKPRPKPPGAVPTSRTEPVKPGEDIAWGKRVSPAFRDKTIAIAGRLGIDPSTLMAIMAFETGRTFSPSVPNKAGSGAIGLIQFMPATAAGLGTSSAALAAMTDIEQLDFVEKHFRPFAGRMPNLASAYMAVLLPSAVTKPVSHVLFAAPSKAYTLNKGLDADDDGKVTKAEAAAKVQAMLVEGMRPENLG